MALKSDESFQRLLDNTADDEPVFLLVGRDCLAATTVFGWAAKAEAIGVNPAKVAEADGCAEAMRLYRPRKVPD